MPPLAIVRKSDSNILKYALTDDIAATPLKKKKTGIFLLGKLIPFIPTGAEESIAKINSDSYGTELSTAKTEAANELKANATREESAAKLGFFRRIAILGEEAGRAMEDHFTYEKVYDEDGKPIRVKKDEENTRQKKLVAAAGTLIYAQAENWNNVSYRYVGGDATGKLASRPNMETLPNHDRENGERRARLRFQVAMACGRAFADGHITATEAMAARSYTAAYHELVASVVVPRKMLGTTVTPEQLGEINLAPTSDILWPRLTTNQASTVKKLLKKYQTTYNPYLPLGMTIEDEHLPAFSACAMIILLHRDQLTEDDSDLDEGMFDFFCHVSPDLQSLLKQFLTDNIQFYITHLQDKKTFNAVRPFMMRDNKQFIANWLLVCKADNHYASDVDRDLLFTKGIIKYKDLQHIKRLYPIASHGNGGESNRSRFQNYHDSVRRDLILSDIESNALNLILSPTPGRLLHPPNANDEWVEKLFKDVDIPWPTNLRLRHKPQVPSVYNQAGIDSFNAIVELSTRFVNDTNSYTIMGVEQSSKWHNEASLSTFNSIVIDTNVPQGRYSDSTKLAQGVTAAVDGKKLGRKIKITST